MKQLLRLLPPLLAVLLLTGMGGLGGTPEGSLPETAEDIRAIVVDRQGVRTELSRFSLEGRTSLEGMRGSGRVTVPFGELVAADFGEAAGGRIPTEIQLASGESVQLGIDHRVMFAGSTGYGIFRIRAGDVQRIEFPR